MNEEIDAAEHHEKDERVLYKAVIRVAREAVVRDAAVVGREAAGR